MIIFRNPGLVDIDALTTMGVSVKNPGSFGFFGTGFKYSVATILRNGGTITVHRGTKERCEFVSRKVTIRDQPFDKVFMIKTVGEKRSKPVDLHITTQLGKQWEAWQVLRELGCNAMDEGGDFFMLNPSQLDGWPGPAEDETTVIVHSGTWKGLDGAMREAGTVFFGKADRKIAAETSAVQVAEGESSHIFYRGIRALRLEHRSVFTYNILSKQNLSEDRHLTYEWSVKQEIRDFWLKCEDKALLKQALVCGSGAFEFNLDYDQSYYGEPNRAFMDVVYEAQFAKESDKVAPGAMRAYSKALRKQTSEERAYARERARKDAFDKSLDAIYDIFWGVIPEPKENQTDDKFVLFQEDPLGIKQLKFVMLDSLEGDQLIIREDGRFYVSREIMKLPKYKIVDTLLRCILRNDGRSELDLLIPVALQTHRYTSHKRYTRLSQDEELNEPHLVDEELQGEEEPLAIELILTGRDD